MIVRVIAQAIESKAVKPIIRLAKGAHRPQKIPAAQHAQRFLNHTRVDGHQPSAPTSTHSPCTRSRSRSIAEAYTSPIDLRPPLFATSSSHTTSTHPFPSPHATPLTPPQATQAQHQRAQDGLAAARMEGGVLAGEPRLLLR